MITVGDTLRRERVRRNLELGQISKELKISPRFLEAIEDERFEKLPGGVFAKAFVRQYSRLLGLNEDELAAQLDQVLEPPPAPDVEMPHQAKTGLAPLAMPRMEEWKSVGDRRVSWSAPLSAAIVVVLVMLVCSGVYAWMQRQQHAPATAHNIPAPTVPVQTPPQQQAAPVEPPATAPPTAQPSESHPVAASPVPVQPEAPVAAAPTPPKTEAEAGATPGPPGPVHVEVTATEPVWILARADGKFAFTGTMDPNSKRTADGSKEVTLRLGNAGGVTITLNGQPIPSVGPKGQPRTVQFNSSGFHIVPAKPPSESPTPIGQL